MNTRLFPVRSRVDAWPVVRRRPRRPAAQHLAQPTSLMFESLEERIALTINYAIAPGSTLDIYPLSSIIPASPGGMDRMEVLLTTVPGVSHGLIYRVSGTEAYVWGSGAPNVFTVGAGNDRITAGEGFRYVNNGSGDGTSESIPVKFRNSTGSASVTDTIVISIDSNLHPPTITTQPTGLILIGQGTRATMSVVATGTPAPTYQWYTGFVPDTTHPISGATSATYTTPILNVIQQYHYWVRVSNSGGHADSIGVTVDVETPTSVTTSDVSTPFKTSNRFINLSATVSPAENIGNVTFTSLALGGVTATSGTVTNGLTGNVPFTIPGGSAVGTYSFQAHYQAPSGVAESFDTKTITITKASTTTSAMDAFVNASSSAQSIPLSATISSAAGSVAEGTVTFTVQDGATVIGTVTSGTVTNSAASANLSLPANSHAGVYTISAVYNPGADYLDSSDSGHTLTVNPKVTPNLAVIPATSTSLVINGFGFDSASLASNTVGFPVGVTGTVSAATPTQLTISNLSGLVGGPLNLAVSVHGLNTPSTQVAAIAPVITSSAANLGITTSSLIINGFGFSPTPAGNVLALSSGTGTVTASSKTQMTVSLSGVQLGILTAKVTTGGVGNAGAVPIATVIPVVTSSALLFPANSTSLTIAGAGFSTVLANDHVAFSGGVTGTVTAATPVQLTVSNLSGLKAGPLNASVIIGGLSSGTAVQVASVIPVVTPSSSIVPATATSLTIAGFGFDSTPANNVVAFSGGVTGTVTAATPTQLTISNLTGLIAGPLSAMVTVNGIASTSAQVSKIAPVVTMTATAIKPNATTVVITGVGFADRVATAVDFSSPVTGFIASSNATTITYTVSSLLPAGILSASVTGNGVSSGALVEIAVVDGTPPTASNGRLNLDSPNFGTVSIDLSEQIDPALLLSHFHVSAIGGGNFTPSAVVQDATTHTATFSFASPLPDGNYHATLSASGLTDAAGNPMASDFSFNFYVLSGDANRDRSVGFADLVLLAQHYGASNSTYGNGDVNGDGAVGFGDLVIVAQNYGKSLPLPAASVPAAVSSEESSAPLFSRKRIAWSPRRASDLLA